MKNDHLEAQLFQNIINALPLLLFWTDNNHVCLGSNSLHAASFGYSLPSELVGVGMGEMFRRKKFDNAFIKQACEENEGIIKNKKGRIIEHRGVLSDGNAYHYLCRKAPLLAENGGVIGVTVLSVDITPLEVMQKNAVQRPDIATLVARLLGALPDIPVQHQAPIAIKHRSKLKGNLKKSPDAPAKESKLATVIPIRRGRKLTARERTMPYVLIVEAHSMVAAGFSMTLKTCDCITEIATTASKGVEMAKTENYDLIFMDVELPDYSGMEAAKKIRALPDAKKSQVPIIGMARDADNVRTRRESLGAGMQDLLPKFQGLSMVESVLEQYVSPKSFY